MKFELKSIDSILLIRFGSLGDVVLTTPVIGALRKAFPDAYIAMLVGDKSFDIVSADPRLDEIIVFHRETKGIDGLKETKKVVELLKERHFNISIDLQRKFRSAYIAYMSKANLRIGYHKPFAFLCNIKVHDKINKHAVDHNLDLLKPLGIKNADREAKIYVSDEDRKFALDIFRSKGIDSKEPILGIFPGAGWRPRCWMPERFAEIADLALEQNNKVILFAGPGEDDIVDSIIQKMKSKPILMNGKFTLRQLSAMIEICDVMLSNDTGPMHISVAMGTKTVALFGPGNHIKFQPIGEKHATIRHNVPCSPCKQFTNKCKDNICMKLITVDEVWDAVNRRLIQFSI